VNREIAVNVLDFISADENGDLWWWLDPTTAEIVTECRQCGGEARHLPNELEKFLFTHEPWCPARTGVPIARA
jgi:hypothetical protein